MGEVLILACIIVYIAFRNWLEHDKRRMIHRERIAAIEKGIELPAIEQEAGRRSWNVQRYLLLAGWSFIFIGVAVFIAINVMTSGMAPGQFSSHLPPRGAQYLGFIPIGFGIAHLITYWVGQKREQR